MPSSGSSSSRGTRLVPLTALASACSTLLCCLPLGFAGALGLAGLGAIVAPLRPWLVGAAVAMLAFAFMQVYRQPRECRPKSRLTMILLWGSAVIVAAVALLPQLVAALLADWLG